VEVGSVVGVGNMRVGVEVEVIWHETNSKESNTIPNKWGNNFSGLIILLLSRIYPSITDWIKQNHPTTIVTQFYNGAEERDLITLSPLYRV
jgi:hypothetical protein